MIRQGPLGAHAALLADRIAQPVADASFRDLVRTAADVTRELAADAMASQTSLAESTCARLVAERLPAGSALMLGNSLPIRTIDVFAARRPDAVDVYCQRGANGIDGLVAGACGAAAARNAAFTLLLGDVSLLHDLGSLMLAANAKTPLVIVVVQNHGGRIFDQLPIGAPSATVDTESRQVMADTLSHISTEHTFDFTHAAAQFGLNYETASTADELSLALDRAYGSPRATLIEAKVPDRAAAKDARAFWQKVDVALDARVIRS